ncbi:nucleotide exchange factor GrpE [Pontiella agarivorans]|uniref:Protein GrpE n=1 Tax=Pontiella agarivorans TaxID=3038953 RepID=A0ABU5MX94_9BACT|nr:nucleotide exchange factor GrpE [Pontiella agarivorans]MDZ8118753.1 nucleotide exchange factor GrpE [Pontiella agarivorans]
MAKKEKIQEEELKAEEAIAEEAVEETSEAVEELPDTEVIEDEETAQAVEEEEDESLRDQLVRLQADFTNFRNRTQRERIELYQRANEDLLLEILPVLDHYEMGLETAEQHEADKAVVDGFKMVYDQFRNVLKKFNLEPIEAVGQEFDPHKHEALTHMPSDEYPAEVCSNQVRRGYMFGDKLLRAAQVVVSSGPAEASAEKGAE